MKQPERYGDFFFQGIETIRHSQYSHHLIANEVFLELKAMESIYLEMKVINDMLDESSWGILYPVYRFYKQAMSEYRRFKRLRKYAQFKKQWSSSA